jgi:hypothetical protein
MLRGDAFSHTAKSSILSMVYAAGSGGRGVGLGSGRGPEGPYMAITSCLSYLRVWYLRLSAAQLRAGRKQLRRRWLLSGVPMP